MKRYAVNTLATTGLALVALSIAAAASGARFLLLGSVFETLAANAAIQLGLTLARRLEPRRAMVEVSLDMGVIMAVLAACGTVFGWFGSTPVWMLALIAAAVYGASALLDLAGMRREAREINELLHRRDGSKPGEAGGKLR